jgi:RNA polymerase sigma-70 factor (ECF subfamily)
LRETPEDRSAWDEFVTRYRPLLTGWVRHWGLQEADAEDVAQTVLLRLAVKLRVFVYDQSQSFRGWLRTMVRNAWVDFLAEHLKETREPGDPLRVLEDQAVGDDLEHRLAEMFDLELLEEATARVRERVEEKTWEAFHRTSTQGEATQDVARALATTAGNVFRAKSKVRQMLQEEIRRLEKEPAP